MKRRLRSVITEHKELAPHIFSLKLKTEMSAEAVPGQFIGIYPKDGARILMRPISICDSDAETGELRMVYRAAGKGTAEISGYGAGESLDILGMLGNGYDLEAVKEKKVILLGGGIGIPPMLYSAKRLKEQGTEVTAVLGYADSNTFLKEDFEKYCTVQIASMEGSVGTKGTVIDAMNENGTEGDVIFACGPMPMLKAVKSYAADHGMQAFISLEERMACGVGACLGCVVKTREVDHHTHVKNTRICVEGPVFNAEDVDI
ncbi:dihydroorotate dehydrogenase electron transfer subunit [Lachnospiraceae bacterium XPB1003]|nr:dihydroorotate dehydrogenase electron transfer subunit [Lachnospiraceae bacterium XPB1003]